MACSGHEAVEFCEVGILKGLPMQKRRGLTRECDFFRVDKPMSRSLSCAQGCSWRRDPLCHNVVTLYWAGLLLENVASWELSCGLFHTQRSWNDHRHVMTQQRLDYLEQQYVQIASHAHKHFFPQVSRFILLFPSQAPRNLKDWFVELHLWSGRHLRAFPTTWAQND